MRPALLDFSARTPLDRQGPRDCDGMRRAHTFWYLDCLCHAPTEHAYPRTHCTVQTSVACTVTKQRASARKIFPMHMFLLRATVLLYLSTVYHVMWSAFGAVLPCIYVHVVAEPRASRGSG